MDSQAPQYFSKCRSAIAALYQWHSKHARDKEEAARLAVEADLAHRQALALSALHPEVVWRYTDYLLGNQRTNDAKILVASVLRAGLTNGLEMDSDALNSCMPKLRKEADRLG